VPAKIFAMVWFVVGLVIFSVFMGVLASLLTVTTVKQTIGSPSGTDTKTVIIRKQFKENTRADWFKITELVPPYIRNDGASKANLHLDDRSSQVVSFLAQNILKEIENSLFLSSFSINLLAFYHKCLSVIDSE